MCTHTSTRFHTRVHSHMETQPYIYPIYKQQTERAQVKLSTEDDDAQSFPSILEALGSNPTQHGINWVWWCMSIILVLRKWRQEDSIFKVIFGYIASSRPGCWEPSGGVADKTALGVGRTAGTSPVMTEWFSTLT